MSKPAPRDIEIRVTERVAELQTAGELVVPRGYSPGNAIKAAWLILQDTFTGKKDNSRPVLEVCTPVSIQNALFDMVVQGLDPVKKQCYFIARGNRLTLMRSYFGNLAIARRDAGITAVRANLIHDGDEFAYRIEDGRKRVTKHTQELHHLDLPFTGGYAVVMSGTEVVHTEIMTLAQIRVAWAQGSEYNPARVKFPTEMALRTVVNRALKRIVNSSGMPAEDSEQPDDPLDVAVAEVTADAEKHDTPLLEFTDDTDEPDGPSF